jgi:putative molybdopterin biosynthesis protein
VRALREFLQTDMWKERLRELPGYEPMQSGEVLSLKDQLPWWDFKTGKS